MKFFLQDDISNVVDDILKRLRMLMDGDVSAQMKDYGLEYELNYGTSVFLLKKMAKEYEGDNVLANRLWHRSCRETKILATLIAVEEDSSKDMINEWTVDLDKNEIAEQLGANLLWRLSGLLQISKEWLNDESMFRQASVWAALSVFLQKGGELDLKFCDEMLEKISVGLETDSHFLQRTKGRFLRQLCRKSEDVLLKVQDLINGLSGNENADKLVLDVQTEIDFLKEK